MAFTVQELNADLASVTERVRGGLVLVRAGFRGSGAGTVWHPDGLIVTNAHVVARAEPLVVTLPDGRTLPAKVLARDPERDLAALTVEAHGLSTVELGDSRSLRAGQWVMALGHPWGVPGSVTAGMVIAMDGESPGMPQNGHEWVVVNLKLRPGYSGGPLFDTDGRLVGINTLMTGWETGAAVPVHVAKAFLKEWSEAREAALAKAS
jgi:serine protease Do